MRQFRIGEVVSCIPYMFPRNAAHGDYKIVAAMPDQDGDHIYRIKSPLEEYKRVVGENLLVRSDGCLPEKVLELSPLRKSITLPKLRIALRVEAEDEPCSWSIASVPELLADA